MEIILFVVLYRLSPFHPLACYPGPITRRISLLVPAFLAVTGNRCKELRRLHARYGDVVRIGK